jgi:hypothetical protein
MSKAISRAVERKGCTTMIDSTFEKEARLQRYLDGQLSAEDGALFEREILASGELAEELVDEISLRDLVVERRERVAKSRRARRRRLPPWVYSSVAAAVLILALVRPWKDNAAVPVFRNDGTPVIEAIEPIGQIEATPSLLRWSGIEVAANYRVEVYDTESLRVLTVTVRGTTYSLQDGEVLPSSGYWQVTPIDEFGVAGTRSAAFRFNLID